MARRGMRLYHTARHYGSMADRGIRDAAHIYVQAIQPALRNAGMDTQKTDKYLKNTYDHYNLYSDAVKSGVNVADGIAANLRMFHFSTDK